MRRLYSIPSGLMLGIVLALLLPQGAPTVAWIGQIFLSLLKLLILPLILVSIYAALARGRDLWHIGARALLYYLITSCIAATLGTLIGLAFSRNVPVGLLELAPVSPDGAVFSLERLITNLIPSNLFASLAEGNILHIVVVAVLVALASHHLQADQRDTLLAGARALDALLIQLLAGILTLAPVGIAALVYTSLAAMDWAEILRLHAFVWAVVLATGLHALVVLPLLYYRLTGRSPWHLVLACREPLLTALSTASSSATYPVSKRALERFGVPECITSLTLPMGATLNMDGSALYQSILLIFMSQLAGSDLSLWQALYIVLLTMTSSAGTAGIPGGGLAMMAFMLDLLGLPQTYLALYLVVDRFFDYPITAVNVWGDLVVAASLSKDAPGQASGSS
ncbi:dicarboxylate/amino acid:cation symporter [Thermochromatium tepidum]|uniref:Cation:dicarboxylase symporter family transporter n=1 Tax=Thermochromatium tepidum ATCC 43061 TaxID=316276 RepID=A0A6I6EF84_THETI|nr:dicarboxylate/amino acid:cation symporter [Thermochromatium tepidum]QGU32027.1 cation:dicarboxylase symporter family transporter [Thermochromatium tepidum ATCC 43061]